MNPIGIIGTEFIRIEPEAGGFASKLKGVLGEGTPIGKLFGLSVVAGIGIGLFAIGEEFEKARHQIQKETGLTGAALEKQFESVKKVLVTVPAPLKDVTKAMDLLRQRTGLTGGPLEKLATQQLYLAKITGTDLASNITAGTALMNKYGITVAQQGAKFDVLFKAAQQTGVSVDTITGLMTRGGSALQAFGLNFDGSAALVAKFSQVLGTNAPKALQTLNAGFSKIAKAGGDPHAVLLRLIHDFQGGAPHAKAMAEAVSLLGARGGLEFATAISKGAFAIGDLTKKITDGKGGITETGVATLSLGEKFQILKNKVLVALEPIATKLLDLVTKGFDFINAWIESHGPEIQTFFNRFAAVVGTVVGAFQQFVAFLTGTVWPVIQQVVAVIVGKFQELSAAVASRWNDIRASIEHVLQAIQLIIAVTLAPIFLAWKLFHNQIMAVVSTVWTLIKAIVQNALQVIQGIIDIVLGVLSGHWSRAWKGIQEVVGGVWNLIVAIVKGAIGLVWQAIQAGLILAGTVVRNGINAIVGFFQKLPGRILGAIGDATTWLFHVGQQIMAGLVNGITHAGVNIGQAIINQLPGPVKGLVGGLLGIGGSSTDFNTFINGLGKGSSPQRRTGQARALGGPVMAGVGYPVGEHGPEWFQPGQSGTIIPNRGAGGGVTIVLAPTFPPGMDAATALAHMQAFTVETIAKTFEDVAANGRVGSGRNR